VGRLKRAFKNPIPPRLAQTGPVKDNIVARDDIDQCQFPAPKWHATTAVATLTRSAVRSPQTRSPGATTSVSTAA
jgi:hypothetical protein